MSEDYITKSIRMPVEFAELIEHVGEKDDLRSFSNMCVKLLRMGLIALGELPTPEIDDTPLGFDPDEYPVV